MTYIKYIEFIIDFTFIQLMEASFIVFLTMVLCKIELNLHKVLATIFISSVIGSFLLPFGNYEILNRVICIALVGITIMTVNEVSLKMLLKIYLNMAITLLIMMMVEFISLVPLMYFMGTQITTIQEQIFSAVVFFIPLRVFEYIVCHLVYIKFGCKN